ncbi:hypothetical protein [Leifsonia soli]|uniref:TnsA-like heteromeric transposase endonuclease subunit n=1 Tax=Leifsonia soli TaxID=582665 RepID=A0A852T402_9MICO|nr:hypothetical protein [Leifsonia soli]NYD75250.1 hypothetical protein [Leifsonia soli]
MRPAEITKQILTRRRSPRTELHWVSRISMQTPGGTTPEQQFATVQSEIGGWDWVAIDPMLVRTSKGLRHGFTGALYFWQRTRSHIWCESQAERWEVLWLDFSGEVERLWAQPLAIAFGLDSRLAEYWHIPDFMAQFRNGSFGLYDVRPVERIDDRAKLQFEETAKVCNVLGWQYKVLTGHDIRATQNLNGLSVSRHDRCKPAPPAEALILDLARFGATRRELCLAASPSCPPLACAWVDYLAWHRQLTVSLNAPLTSDTVYTTT